MCKRFNIILLLVVVTLAGCKTTPVLTKDSFSHFAGLENFSSFSHSRDENGQTILLSPPIEAQMLWNEIIVSWDAEMPAGTFIKIEGRALSASNTTKFYKLGDWTLDNRVFPRTSVRGQRDADGEVDTDTLILSQPAAAAQIRITLGGTNLTQPHLKFLGVSFSNTKVPPTIRPPNRVAWGKIVATPEHSQLGYPNGNGWCSPTSLSMVLSRWGGILNRPEMDLTVPQVAAAVYDESHAGTGNWPFNTAFAGSFPGMRSYVTRMDDLAEVEDWIVAGIPVILSARWDWLEPGRPSDNNGHLIVCIGFTKDGNVIINDPATRLDRGESVRHIYNRADVMHSWTKSHNTVYLVFPENEVIPANRYGHW